MIRYGGTFGMYEASHHPAATEPRDRRLALGAIEGHGLGDGAVGLSEACG